MTIITRPVATTFARALTLSALFGATLLGGTALSGAAFAQTAATPPAATSSAEMKAESVEQRITSLHESLKITASEEANWTPVAQTMRDNAAAMQKLVAEKKAQSPANMTALDDMMNYQTFAQAHVDGLKKLNATFKTLYDAMPADQKAVADETFRSFGRDNAKHG
jgi:protein CpxP